MANAKQQPQQRKQQKQQTGNRQVPSSQKLSGFSQLSQAWDSQR